MLRHSASRQKQHQHQQLQLQLKLRPVGFAAAPGRQRGRLLNSRQVQHMPAPAILQAVGAHGPGPASQQQQPMMQQQELMTLLQTVTPAPPPRSGPAQKMMLRRRRRRSSGASSSCNSGAAVMLLRELDPALGELSVLAYMQQCSSWLLPGISAAAADTCAGWAKGRLAYARPMCLCQTDVLDCHSGQCKPVRSPDIDTLRFAVDGVQMSCLRCWQIGNFPPRPAPISSTTPTSRSCR